MKWGFTDSALGSTIVAFDGDLVFALYFSDGVPQFLVDFPNLRNEDRDDRAAGRMVERILGDDPRLRPVYDHGSGFERAVWDALCRIPKGRTCTYSEVAQAIGRKEAVRAVGSAIGRNPISYLVPCHRVVRRDGTLGGYRWGVDVKRALLEREKA